MNDPTPGARGLPSGPSPAAQFNSGILLNSNGGNRVVNKINEVIAAMGIGGEVGPITRRDHVPNCYYRFWEEVPDQIGVYKAKRIINPKPDVVADLVEADLGTQSADPDLIVWSLEEMKAGSRLFVVGEQGDIGTGVAIQVDAATKLTIVLQYGAVEWVRWVKITGSTLISPNRWKYTWIEQKLERTGLWLDKPDGLTSASDGYSQAYNTIETNNSATGVQGNGIDLTTLPGNYAILPARGTPVVELWRTMNCDGVVECFFQYENGVGGTCPS